MKKNVRRKKRKVASLLKASADEIGMMAGIGGGAIVTTGTIMGTGGHPLAPLALLSTPALAYGGYYVGEKIRTHKRKKKK